MMFDSAKNSVASPNFTIAWLIIGLFILMQGGYIVLCHSFGAQIQHPLVVEQRILIRSLFYVFSIILFPLTTLLRYIGVRLNQTMTGDKPAHCRYLNTVIVSQSLMEIVGILGFVMFILGDEFNTLYIFSGLALLGFFLQRPKREEYFSIVTALEKQA
jgi:preprotein translocase subunit Sss1